jgi:hypothetical protein
MKVVAEGTVSEPDEVVRESGTSRAVSQASELLLYAVERGNDVKPDIRDAILRAEAALQTQGRLTLGDHAAFLSAYASLATLMAPVTATTLEASDKRFGRRPLFVRLLGLKPMAEAQLQAVTFGAIAAVLLVLIAFGGFAQVFITSVTEKQQRRDKIVGELAATTQRLTAVERQRETLEGLDRSIPNRSGLLEALSRQLAELTVQGQALTMQEKELGDSVTEAYKTLSHWVPNLSGEVGVGRQQHLKNIIEPIASMLNGFAMPILFGGLGTCAYILRAIYAQMVRHSFEPHRIGEYMVRIFLGTMSGVALQWLVVGDATQIAGIKPAGIAFVAGYSVELLFSAIDRALTAALGSLKPPLPAETLPPGPAGRVRARSDAPATREKLAAASDQSSKPDKSRVAAVGDGPSR